MAQRDGTAVQVHLLVHHIQQAQPLEYRQGLGGEGFVQLHHIQIVDTQACLFQCLLAGRYRTVTHDGGIAAGHTHADHPSTGR